MYEWVLYRTGNWWHVIGQSGSDDHYRRNYLMYNIADNPDSEIVKVYSETRYDVTVADIELGYCEKRLSALDRLKILNYIARYWDIPF